MGIGPSHVGETIHFSPNLWNFRGSFNVAGGMINVGTQMSLVKLSNDNFLVIDTMPMSICQQAEFDRLTNKGKLIEAVVATHPFHTLSFPDFYQSYPNVPYYGTPRHLRNLTQIPWAGDITNENVRTLWKDDIEMRIPDGAEWVNPQPESTNHFTSCWVYCKAAKTIHVDDTLTYIEKAPFVTKLFVSDDTLMFHHSMAKLGLYHTSDGPNDFRTWVQSVLDDWKFDNLCCAHLDNKIGSADKALQDLLNNSDTTFQELISKFSKESCGHEHYDSNGKDKDKDDSPKYNVKGNECG